MSVMFFIVALKSQCCLECVAAGPALLRPGSVTGYFDQSVQKGEKRGESAMGKMREKGLFPKTLLEMGNAKGTQISGTLRKLWARTWPMVTLGHAL